MPEIQGAARRKIILKDWMRTGLEILKWAVVIWLIWPLTQMKDGQFHFLRVLLGILLFIIFAGKTFYDIIIMDIIKQRRFSLKQDIITFIGVVLGVVLIVGLILGMVAAFIVQWAQSTGPAAA